MRKDDLIPEVKEILGVSKFLENLPRTVVDQGYKLHKVAIEKP